MGEEQCFPVTLARTAAPALPARRAESSADSDSEAASEQGSAEDLAVQRALVDRARAGDQRAFRELYQRYAQVVHRYAIIPLVHDRTLAEDILADTFVRALENLHRFRWQGKGVLPWLIRIAKNLCLDHLRKSGRVAAWPLGLEHLIPDPTELNAETLTAHREVSQLLRERIDGCLSGINPRYRKVVQLRLIEAMPRDRAAQAMGVSIGTLDVLLFRACKAFRKVYVERYGSGPSGPELGDA